MWTDGVAKVASQCLQNKRSLTVAVFVIITPEEVRTPTPPRVRLHSGTRKIDTGDHAGQKVQVLLTKCRLKIQHFLTNMQLYCH